MTWQGVVFLTAHLVAAVLTFGLAVFAWRNREKRGARAFSVLMVGAAAWATSDALVLVVAGVEAKLFFRTVGYLWHNVVAVAVLAFALTYTGTWRRVGRRGLVLLALEPMAVGLLVTPTNALGLHRLVWTDVSIAWIGDVATLSRSFGPWYWANTGYNYLLVLAAMGLFVQLAVASSGAHRKQATAIVVGAVPPFAANVLWVLGVTSVDFTPVALAVTGLVFGLALFRFGLLDLVPIARNAVLERIQEGYVVIDDRDRVVDANPAARELLAVGTEAIGSSARDLLPQGGDLLDRHDHAETVESTVAVGAEPRYLEVEVRSLVPDTREVRLVVLRDVTQRRRREEALREQNERLDEFASVVSHDLRNPLSVIAGRIALARETGDLTHLEAAEETVGRMESLIDDLLSLAREGASVGETTPTSVESVARDAWASVASSEASLDLVGDAVVEADAARLRELLENLYSNAIEHAGAGVSIRTGATDGGFYVEDDGPGIPEPERDLVFTRGVSGSPGGTGYGLAIVERIAEAHGWNVDLVEGDAGGARFEFSVGDPDVAEG